MRGIKIPNHKNMSIHETYHAYCKPDYVTIPLKTYANTECECLVKVGDYVEKRSVIARSKDKFLFPIHSSISGVVIKIEEKDDSMLQKVQHVVIENDFLEKEKKIGSKQKINTYTKKEVLQLLKECAVVGMSGLEYPTYYKYGTELKIKKLIVNAVESESYLTSDFTILNDKTSEILEAIDALLEIFEIEECIIAVKEFNKKAVEYIIQYLGTYTNIIVKSVPDLFTMGWEKNLVKYFYHQNIKKYPIEKSIVVNNVSTIYSIYEALKYRRPVVERVITISGNAIQKPQNVLVKVGTKISDLCKEIGEYNVDDCVLVMNGPMMGYEVTLDTVITKGTRGNHCQKKEQSIDALECMNCGKCTNICPVRLAPVLITKNTNEKIIKLLHPEKCIECGMCSYICPAKIQVRNEVQKKKEQLLKDR